MFFNLLKVMSSGAAAQGVNFLCVLLISTQFADSEIALFSKVIALTAITIVCMDFGCNQLIISRSNKGVDRYVLIIKLSAIVSSLVLLALFWDALASLYNIPLDILPYFLFYVITTSLSNSIAYSLQGKGDMRFFLIVFYGRVITHFSILFLFLVFDASSQPYMDWLIIGCIVNLAFVLVFGFWKKQKLSLERHDGLLNSSLKKSMLYFLSALAVVLMLRVDAIILGGISDEWLAEFFKVKAIALGISLVSTSFSHMFMTKIKQYTINGWPGYMREVCKAFLMFLPVSIIMLIMAPTVYSKLYGDISTSANYIMLILICAYSTGVITNPINALLLRAEKASILFKMNIIQLIIIYGLSSLLAAYSPVYVAMAIFSAHVFSLVFTLKYVRSHNVQIFRKIKASFEVN